MNGNVFTCFAANNNKQVEVGASSVEFYDGYVVEKNQMKVNRHFYGVYDSTGSFLGYYNVAYSIYTYVENTLIDTQAGTYQSLYVG